MANNETTTKVSPPSSPRRIENSQQNTSNTFNDIHSDAALHCRRDSLLCPVTALAFFTSSLDGRLYLIAGEDTQVRIYDVQTARICGDDGVAASGQIPVFGGPGQAVHGIIVSEDVENYREETQQPRQACKGQILIWGGEYVSVLSKAEVEGFCQHRDSSVSYLDSGNIPCRSGATSGGVRKCVGRAPDWILDGAFSPSSSTGQADMKFVLLTAHNEVVVGWWDGEQDNIQFGGLYSPSRPILYSGSVVWEKGQHSDHGDEAERNDNESILVAAGTVFGEILVWRCHNREEKPWCETLHVFTGHEGSIFGVDISPEWTVFEDAKNDMESEPRKLRLLASCSDDRTIRVWDITENRQGNERQKPPDTTVFEMAATTQVARETGFGNSESSSVQISDQTPFSLSECNPRSLAVIMGHASRIWHVVFPRNRMPDRISGPLDLWSFGEDATAQLWNLDVDRHKNDRNGNDVVDFEGVNLASKLTHNATFSLHSGKNIWSKSMTYRHEGKLLIATGGFDGRISLLRNMLGPGSAKETICNVPSAALEIPEQVDATIVSESITFGTESMEPSNRTKCITDSQQTKKRSKSKSKKDATETFYRYTFLTEDRVLAITSLGRLLLGTFGTHELSWEELILSIEAQKAVFSYAVMASSRENSIALVGTATGDIFVYHPSLHSMNLLINISGKVADIFNLDPGLGANDSVATEKQCKFQAQFLISTLERRNSFLLEIKIVSGNAEVEKTDIVVEGGLVITSTLLFNNTLFLGSRDGRILVLQHNCAGTWEKITVLDDRRIQDAITSISIVPRETSDAPLYILTTSRDGKYRIHAVIDHRNKKSSSELQLIHEISPPFGPLIEGAWFSDTYQDGSLDLVLCGFRSQNFVVWNETQRREIAAVPCGGGHRTFKFTSLRKHPDSLRFLYTKAGQLHLYTQERTPHQVLKQGGHGREIKAIATAATNTACSSQPPSNRDCSIMATAAEDTTIRLWDSRSMKCLAILEKHTAGIQRLQWHSTSDDQLRLFSSAGNEELFVWRVRRLPGSRLYGLVAVVCEKVFMDRSEIGDLRVMDFDVLTLHESITATGARESAGKIEPVLCVSMALSNSTLQTYTYSETGGFLLLAKGSYTGACLTQLRHLHVKRINAFGTELQMNILTASTDGHLAIWKTKTSLNPSLPDAADSSRYLTANNDEENGNKRDTAAAEYECILTTKLHLNSIKSLTVASSNRINWLGLIDKSEFLIITGGDDNSLGISYIGWDAEPGVNDDIRPKVWTKAVVRRAHTAAITGVVILDVARQEKRETRKASPRVTTIKIATTGNDQRVKLWRLTLSRWSETQQTEQTQGDTSRALITNGMNGHKSKEPMGMSSSRVRAELLEDHHSAVADAGGLEFVGDQAMSGDDGRIGRIFVGGVGLENWVV